jgi:hypothetical protein
MSIYSGCQKCAKTNQMHIDSNGSLRCMMCGESAETSNPTMNEDVSEIINRLKMDVAAMKEQIRKLTNSEIQAKEEVKFHREGLETTKSAALKLSRAFDRLFVRTRQGVIQKLKNRGVSDDIIKEIELTFPKEIQFPEAKKI